MKLRFVLVMLVFVLASAQGDPAEGKKVFAKMRCDSCHSAAVTTGGRTAHPLPDLSAQAPNAVAQSIVKRTTPRPAATFDEIAMSSAAARLTTRDIENVVAYLRSR